MEVRFPMNEMETQRPVWSWWPVVMVLAIACDGVEGAGAPQAAAAERPDGALRRAQQEAGAAVAARAAVVARGRYLVENVAACTDCHSPKRPDGSADPERWLGGVDCWLDTAPDDPDTGCLSTRNLTNHATGLRNRTDREIQDMFLRGKRPDGKALHPAMPYAYLGNMRASDADAIVAFLRTVPGVDHTVTASQTPFLPPAQPAPRVPVAVVPMPRADYPQRDAALRGRYIAGEIGTCLSCHTPRGERGPAFDRAFQGGGTFARALLGLGATYPETVYSANLTPHATGIAGYSVEGLVRVLRRGEDRRGERLCPPMPAGPTRAFGGLTDDDAGDIAHYLLSLPPADHAVPDDCQLAADAP